MRILLVSANRLSVPYPVYPIGLDYVAGGLGQKHPVEIVDVAQQSEEEIRGVIDSFDPQLVGLAIRNIDNSDAVESLDFIQDYRTLAKLIRDASDAPLVLGGSGFTIAPGKLVEALGADYGVVGEGERLALLADRLEAGQSASDLDGVVEPAGRPAVPSLWEGGIERRFRSDDPTAAHYLKKGGMLNLQTKRGCPYSCIYCTYPTIEGRRLRRFEPAAVAHTARELQEAGAKFLFVTDAVFNCDPDHAVAVAEALRRAGVTVPWGGYFSPNEPTGEFWPILARCGLTHVEFGTESLSGPMLRTYRKPFDRQAVFAAHRAAVEAGVYVAHFFLLGGPGETEETLGETFENAARLEECVCFFFCGIRIYPGTELCALARRQGQINEQTDLLEPVFYSPEGLSLKRLNELVEARVKGRSHWVAGSGGARMARVLSKMYDMGHTGPLWEKLIR